MRRLFILVAVLFVFSLPVKAQDSYPSAEIFGGYSYLAVDTGGVDLDGDDDFEFGDRESFHGFGFSVAGNISSSVGIVGDFSYNRKSVDVFGEEADLSAFIFLFGPRFTARGDSVDGFVHAMIGAARQKVSTTFQGFDFDISETDLALGFGGGIDIRATDSIGIRLLQLDYIPVKGEDNWSHNFRAQIGIVFKLGGS